MSAVLKKLTVAEYLEIERKAERKSEFFDGEMFAMAGASVEHNDVKTNLIGELFTRLKGGDCRIADSDQRVLIEATGLITYPDIIITCGPREFDPADRNTLLNPKAIIEVLSPSTANYDRGTKFEHYQRIPSLVEYILVEQDKPVCERYIRQEDDSWGRVSFIGLNAELKFTSVPVSIPMSDVYAGVTFSEPRLR